ncbi:hypothetical protein HK101_011213 [Irineochytrium annulatum]|nr:hypothetical protein HK101_011213 [Irineochytrium annulatum]
MAAFDTAGTDLATLSAPDEVRLLDLIAKQHPHGALLALREFWEDELHHYAVTDLHADMDDVSADRMDDDEAAAGLVEFTDPESGERYSIPHDPTASSDLWTWSLRQSERPRTGTEEDTPVFTLPHIGYTLNPPPLESCRRIFSQVSDALHHLHENVGVAHLDLKEENVLIRWGGKNGDMPEVKLADLGHAIRLDVGPALRVHRYGTREMTPPELLPLDNPATARRPPPDPRKLDVFALGMLLFSLLHGPGVLPWTVERTVGLGCSVEDCCVVEGEYPLGAVREDLGADVLELLRGMTKIRPEERLTMRDVMEHPWVKECF